MTWTFEYSQRIDSIMVVGLGGTGSQVGRSLARLLYDMKSRGLHIPSLHFVDPDRVEAKNVGRQMFTPADVGRYKAEVLANRFSLALGLPIRFSNVAFHGAQYRTLVIGCVDNHEARKAIHDKLSIMNLPWIDCGNHFASGQVILGTTARAESVQPKDGKFFNLPYAPLVFPQLLEPEPPRAVELSCADLVAQGDQHLFINDMIATVAMQYVYKLLLRQPITSFMTFVDLDTVTVKSVTLSPSDLGAYLPAA
jgi:PRTRC genetic system ThiF family protein